MKHSDIEDLDFYFGEGLSSFDRSPFGGILEHQEIYYQKRGPTKELTAQPTAELAYAPAHEPDEHILFRYGSISRRLALLSPLDRQILAAWHGDSGAAFARINARPACLFPFVPTGHVILHSLTKSTLQTSIQNRLMNSIIVMTIKGPLLSARYQKAIQEANQLYERASQSYSDTEQPKTPRRYRRR